LLRVVTVTVAAVIVLSLFGLNQLAGLGALFAGLVAILLLMVRAARAGSPGHPRLAHHLSWFGRYRTENDAETLAGIVVAAVALWTVLDLFELTGTASVVIIAWIAVAFVYVVAANVAATAVGVCGSIATVAELFVRSACRDTTSARGVLVFVAVVATSAIVFAVVRLGSLPVAPLARRITGGAWALITFGLLDIASFVVKPDGLDIWTGAPGWAPAAVLALVIVVALFAGLAPAFVLRLTGVAVTIATLFLAAAATNVLPDSRDTCGRPVFDVFFALAFAVLVSFGISLFRPAAN
jgi:hypothetical protein